MEEREKSKIKNPGTSPQTSLRGFIRPRGTLSDRSSPLRLWALAFALLLLWGFQTREGANLTPEESLLYRKVRAAQDCLWTELGKRNVESDAGADVDKTGFIGVEWSSITTTIGSQDSKRSACDPLWAAQSLRWFDRLGLAAGDRVVVLSSASFPGMLFAVLAAAEARGLDVDLVVSLGASTWGANRPEAPWPVLGTILREGGFLVTKPLFYMLGGGGGENGGGMPEEGVTALERAAGKEGTELVRTSSFAATVERKLSLIDGPRPKAKKASLVVNIGGSETSLGHDPAAITLPSGLLFPHNRLSAGDGVIALSLQQGFPVLHLLNLRSLAGRSGIAYEKRLPIFAGTRPITFAAVGAALFALVMATHRRWTWEE
jgi:poly-gamma-glutamate system protein